MKGVRNICLDRMLELPACAVICETREESDAILSYIKKEMPERSVSWNENDPRWGVNKENTGYTFFDVRAETPFQLLYWSKGNFEKHGYEVIYFSDLIENTSIEESDLSITDLLGL